MNLYSLGGYCSLSIIYSHAILYVLFVRLSVAYVRAVYVYALYIVRILNRDMLQFCNAVSCEIDAFVFDFVNKVSFHNFVCFNWLIFWFRLVSFLKSGAKLQQIFDTCKFLCIFYDFFAFFRIFVHFYAIF